MAFSIKQVKAKLQEYGVPAENLDTAAEYFCAAHKTDLDAIKEQRDTYKADAETLAAVQKELNDLKAARQDGWKDKHDALKKEYDGYKAEVAAKETKAAKAKAVRDWYEGRGITGKALDIAMRGSTAEIEALELGEDGKIKDAAALEALVKGDFSGLVGHIATRGADTATPPVGTGGSALTKADIYKRDEKGRYVMSASERQKALLENQIM